MSRGREGEGRARRRETESEWSTLLTVSIGQDDGDKVCDEDNGSQAEVANGFFISKKAMVGVWFLMYIEAVAILVGGWMLGGGWPSVAEKITEYNTE